MAVVASYAHLSGDTTSTTTSTVADTDNLITTNSNLALKNGEITKCPIEGASYSALKHAVSRLYRMDDFFSEKLASGFFSEVFKVIHKTNGKTMVLKVNNSCVNRPNVLKEVQLMNSLNHPNVIKLMGVCVHKGQMHALTEFANGGCLEQLINNYSVEFQWIDRINIASDVARGLNYLHSKLIIHRDLTSKNILLKIDPSQSITAIVGDLGLATKVKDLEKESSLPVVGSPYWMAPECINSLPYNAKADVFSYGIVLCEMIARVEADPDYLPRTENFGVDYVEFGKLAKDSPINFLQFTFNCCQVDPIKRPTFNDLLSSIDVIKTRSLMATVLADISRFAGKDERVVMTRKILENILDDKENHDKTIFVKRSSLTLPSKLDFPQINVDNQNLIDIKSTNKNDSCSDLVSIDSLFVGRVMSKDDLFYTPRGKNPFPNIFPNVNVKVGYAEFNDNQ